MRNDVPATRSTGPTDPNGNRFRWPPPPPRRRTRNSGVRLSSTAPNRTRLEKTRAVDSTTLVALLLRYSRRHLSFGRRLRTLTDRFATYAPPTRANLNVTCRFRVVRYVLHSAQYYLLRRCISISTFS